MRARPEPTQLERLSDASFLGKLLVLPANVKLDWKVIVRYKHSSLFGLIICNKEKTFYTIVTRRPNSVSRGSSSVTLILFMERYVDKMIFSFSSGANIIKLFCP